jgi:DNA-binding CsgD family transcriptional regulator
MFQNPEQAFGGTAPLMDTIEVIYAAAQQPDLWKAALVRIAATLHGESIAISAVTADYRTPSIVAMANVSADVWDAFAGYYAAINPIMARAEMTFTGGETRFSHLAISDAELEHTEFYADFYKPNDMHHTVGMRIPFGPMDAAFTCQRSFASGPFGEHADIVCQTLRPHLHRALTLHHQMSQMQTRILGLGAAFDAFDQAVFCIDAAGHVVFSNHLAETLLQTGSDLRLVQKRLRATLPDVDRSLQLLIKSALNPTIIESPQSDGPNHISIDRESHAHPLHLSAAPFRPDANAPADNIAALVLVHDPERKPASRSHALRALYGLTPAETRVAEQLLAGLEIRELAAKMVITLETARFHVKRILSKTGARRQSELMRMMLSLPGA